MLLLKLLSSAPSEEVIEQRTELVTAISIVVIALAVLLLAAAALGRKKLGSTKVLGFAAVSVALSFVLSFIKLELPFGGSVTLVSMLPIIFFAFVCGAVPGLIAGAVYGVLQFIQSAWFISLPQFALDYIFAFAAVALAGTLRPLTKRTGTAFVLGILLVCAVRLAMHTGAGIIYFNMGLTWESLPLVGDGAHSGALLYSLIYNSLYMIPELILLLAVSAYLVPSGQLDRLLAEAGKLGL